MKVHCEYCGHDFSTHDWHSEWGDNTHQHYKTTICERCGRKDCVRVSFLSSGGTRLPRGTSLESMLKKVRQG